MANLGTFQVLSNADCKGDKIKLPESASQRLLSIANISYPLCFELSVPLSRDDILSALQMGRAKPKRRCVYCGVLDFTASDGFVCAPQWILDALQVSHTAVVNVSNISLPKGTFVRLQPHTLLHDAQTKQKLEAALRHFTTLTEESTISVPEMNHLKLNVLQVQPHSEQVRGILIVNTDLVVEFEAPLDGAHVSDQHHGAVLEIDASDEHWRVAVDDAVQKHGYRFYKLRLAAAVENVQIAVRAHQTQHDVDLYASWTHSEPGTSASNYDYHCVDTGTAQILVNSSSSGDGTDTAASTFLYVCVHGFDDQNEHKKNDGDEEDEELEMQYTLSIENISLDAMEMQTLYRASSMEIHDENGAIDKSQPDVAPAPLSSDPNKRFCANCHRFVNAWSFDRHHQHCVKQFYFCAPCKKVVKLAEVDNHNQTLHRQLKCKLCAEMIGGGKQTLLAHQKHECLQRPVECRFCRLPFACVEHGEHEQMCGARTELCVYCSRYIALSLIEQHTMDVHGAQYQEPVGVANHHHVVEDIDANDQTAMMNPTRDYDGMMDGDADADDASGDVVGHSRWICDNCHYNNRPNHTQCKICKTQRGRKVVQMANTKPSTSAKIAAIGGASEIPQRNYEQLLSSSHSVNTNTNISTQTYTKPEPETVDVASRNPVSTTTTTAIIPQRDYEKMLLSNTAMTDIPAEDNGNDHDHDQGDTGVTDSSEQTAAAAIANIPSRDYAAMLALQAQSMPEHESDYYPPATVASSNTIAKQPVAYRSGAAIVPQRNYAEMLVNQQPSEPTQAAVDTSHENNNNNNNNSNSSHWVCPNSQCAHLNRSVRYECSVCHSMKPSYKRSAELLDDNDDGIDALGLDHRWVCKNCDGLNKGSRRKCVYCHAMKSYEPSSKSAAQNMIASATADKPKAAADGGIFKDSERWVCPNQECSFLNKGSRLNCQVCHEQRKDTAVLWGDKTTNLKTHKPNSNAVSQQSEQTKGQQQWNCPICTFTNEGMQCQMCGCPKDGQ